MPNHLESEISPYLLQHAENPVEWYPWGEEPMQRAQAEQKPIFLSIGYAACHWCHVMARESFEDPQIAAYMNENFINIKVDREERPDLDDIYMNAVVSISGSGGWPLSVFLTPKGEPFFGGTYFPPNRRLNLPSFKEILQAVVKLWHEDREKLQLTSNEIKSHLSEIYKNEMVHGTVQLPMELDQAALRLAQAYDWSYGGWGAAPKFPQPMAIEFLLRRASKGDSLSLDTALHALNAMCRGGMHDLLGGGFSRYSTDDSWRVPHFEKMLYDNAQLSRDYLLAYLITRDVSYSLVARSTLDFLAREMRSPEGCFICSLDADSEGVEGNYYLWHQQEVDDLLRSAQKDYGESHGQDWSEIFDAAFDITLEGQIHGQNVLQRVFSNEEIAESLVIPIAEVDRILDSGLTALRKQQELKPRPASDDKVLVAWNGLAIWAFAEAARYLHDNHYLKIAQEAAGFICDHLWTGDNLFRLFRGGHVQQPAFLEDYAAFALGLLALYQTDLNLRWFQVAKRLVEAIETLFHHPGRGYLDTQQDSTLLLQPRSLTDNATPSGNSLVCRLFGQFGALSGDPQWLAAAENMFTEINTKAAHYPTAYSSWLCGADFCQGPILEVALLAPAGKGSEFSAFTEAVWQRFHPNLVLAAAEIPLPPDAPGLLIGRQPVNQRTTAFLCEEFSCQQPVNEVSALLKQLIEKSYLDYSSV